ncbi:N-acetylglucosaminyldiphosphoundecaprenol N-acetyl-beta-D-mannosaminyltransferase [Chitinophaga skermanii]|uniref:N-acetylglucosaminyldiphosphoundecaprenol N-acetyl-beta-D-mannosaminyltransferase n=1 Tax=Chitinophaga skermanii TaxID=331697 RepID=A0A327R3I4_9BACT|nr:WecB/TagA/CpsF family glycosyltransferase [Chitinophaga skermanii]RAJ10522.1 N-acetylglucosaminyldiphosphoundecaprenol N-acetyl-beta-D-mannosaminyltransferase [Chitinophaga skermanii]
MHHTDKVEIMGCPCYCFESEEAAFLQVQDIIMAKNGGYSVAINAEKVMLYERNEKFRDIIANSVLPSPDGAGAVLGMKLLHKKKSIKLDLPRLILKIADANKLRLFVLGAQEEVNATASENIRKLFPNINIVARRNGFFKEDKEIADLVAQFQPDIVIMALGSPKQENLAAYLKAFAPSAFFVGCGGALDILAGKVERAPAFYINNNLEWFYRLASQPSRIKRQKVLPVFFFKLMFTVMKKKLKLQ